MLLKKSIKTLFSLALASSLALIPARDVNVYAQAQGKWLNNSNNWYFILENGNRLKDSWLSYNGNWYYLKSNTEMAKDGWEYIDHANKWAYFTSSGEALSNKWIQSGNYWYYLNNSSYMAESTWLKIADSWYYFANDGKMLSNGWGYIPNAKKWTYFTSSGYALSNSWIKTNNIWYYLDENFYMAQSRWIQSGNYWYFLKDDGKMASSELISVDTSHISYFYPDGSAAENKWVQIDNKWRYFDHNCYMVKDTIIDGYRIDKYGIWIEDENSDTSNNDSTNTDVNDDNNSNNHDSSDAHENSNNHGDSSDAHNNNSDTSSQNDEIEKFKEEHTILNKELDNVDITDKDNLLLALKAFENLSEDNKHKLSSEKIKLDSFYNKITELEEQARKEQEINNAISNFRNSNSSILAKSSSNVQIEDKENLQNALNQFNSLDSEVKQRLSSEKSLLDELSSKITELEELYRKRETAISKIETLTKLDSTEKNNFKNLIRNAASNEIEDILIRARETNNSKPTPSSTANWISYLDKNQKKRDILWTKGITPPTMGNGGDFKKGSIAEYDDYVARYVAKMGWYDTNKMISADPVTNIAIDRSLCFAGVATNMLYWWMDRNEDEITSYIHYMENKPNPQTEKINELKYLFDKDNRNQQRNNLYQFFVRKFFTKTAGFQTDILLDYFINGYKPHPNGGTNEEERFELDQTGAFFNEVFDAKKLTRREWRNSNIRKFGDYLKNLLENDSMIGLEYHGRTGFSHIVTLWGVEYDETGKLVAIYVTDTDDQDYEKEYGMKRYLIREYGGELRISTSVSNANSGPRIGDVHILQLGKEKWNNFLSKINNRR